MRALATFAAAVALTFVQLLPRLLGNVSDDRRRTLHSLAGGVAVAFVFLHLIPEILDRREAVAERVAVELPLVEHDVFLLALLGLVAFYGIEILARRSHEGSRDGATLADQVGIGFFAVYYGAVGYLLWIQALEGGASLVAFTVAMGLHFLVVDYGLRETHERAYAGLGRWLLAAAVLVGWSIGWVGGVPEWSLGIVLSVFAGAVVLVALKAELPTERAGRYGAFVAGVGVYAAVLAVV